MDIDAPGVPLRSTLPAAVRMRAVRKRRRQEMHCIRLWLHATQIEGLIPKGFLSREDRGDLLALEWAIDGVISTVLDETT